MSPVWVNAFVPSGKPVVGCVGVDVPSTVHVDPFHASHDKTRSVDGSVGRIVGTTGGAVPPTGGFDAGFVTSTLTVTAGLDSASGSSIRKKNVSPKPGFSPNGKKSLLVSIAARLVHAESSARFTRVTTAGPAS